ncbi:F-box protein [Rhizoctonia solani 123E]|uniref:F-box protein n=1 Tax=Rhizoctonia solani 123E TaxID=1423351 RepID=A0A074S865_9AGAM|nr:F-box protein [Rhizoctonia solani 123E]
MLVNWSLALTALPYSNFRRDRRSEESKLGSNRDHITWHWPTIIHSLTTPGISTLRKLRTRSSLPSGSGDFLAVMIHLGNAPEDIIVHVALFLGFDDLWRLRQACTRIRVILSSIPVWRTASSRLMLPMWSPSPAIGPGSSLNISGLPAFIQDVWRAAQIDRRWATAKPYSYVHRPVSQEWTDIGLVGGGQWILCTNDNGDVAATTLTQAINHTIGKDMVYHPLFTSNRGWYGLVGWFRALAVLTVQLESNLRSLNICYCALPSLDGSQGPNHSLQYRLDLPGRIPISTIEVCTSSRFLATLCKDPNHRPPWYVDVWSWGPGEDHVRQPPQYTMRTIHFEANDCAIRIVETKEGPHVFVVRANKGATYFEFYDLRHKSNFGQIEPEAQIPVACESLPWSCHQITLPRPRDIPATGNTGYDNPISVVLCAARSPRHSELLAYRVRLHRSRELVSLSFLGGYTLPEYNDVTRCVLGPQGVRGVALVSDPRKYSRTKLMILALDQEEFRLIKMEHSKHNIFTPVDVTIDEVHGTIAILGDVNDLHILLFDSHLIPAEQTLP